MLLALPHVRVRALPAVHCVPHPRALSIGSLSTGTCSCWLIGQRPRPGNRQLLLIAKGSDRRWRPRTCCSTPPAPVPLPLLYLPEQMARPSTYPLELHPTSSWLELGRGTTAVMVHQPPTCSQIGLPQPLRAGEPETTRDCATKRSYLGSAHARTVGAQTGRATG